VIRSKKALIKWSQVTDITYFKAFDIEVGNGKLELRYLEKSGSLGNEIIFDWCDPYNIKCRQYY